MNTKKEVTERQYYLRIPLSLRSLEDEDIIEFLEELGRGNVSPWIRGAIREKMTGYGHASSSSV
jgi:hypothetical protein